MAANTHCKNTHFKRRRGVIHRLDEYKPEFGPPKRPARLDKNFKAAHNRTAEEKQQIWKAMKQHTPELGDVLRAFPGSTVLSLEVNGQTIGEDFSV